MFAIQSLFANVFVACVGALRLHRAGIGGDHLRHFRGDHWLLHRLRAPVRAAALDALPVMLQERIHARTLVGCTGAAQLHATCMSERPPAISVIAGRMPGAKLAASVVTAGDLPHADAPPADWRRLLPELGAAPRALQENGEVTTDEGGELIREMPASDD